MSQTVVAWLRRVRANSDTPPQACLEAAIRVCENRAEDALTAFHWPALSESWRRDADKLRALLLPKEKP